MDKNQTVSGLSMAERREKGLLWIDTGENLNQQVYARGLCQEFNQTRPEETEKRKEIWKKLFASCGEDIWITIGKNVLIAPNVTISGTNYPMHYKARPRGEMYCKEVIIETNLNRFRRSVKGVWQHDKSRRNHEFR